MTSVTDTSVKKSIIVNASVGARVRRVHRRVRHWWPRSHHIGEVADDRRRSSKTRVGGRCYTKQVDGTECDWGQILE